MIHHVLSLTNHPFSHPPHPLHCVGSPLHCTLTISFIYFLVGSILILTLAGIIYLYLHNLGLQLQKKELHLLNNKPVMPLLSIGIPRGKVLWKQQHLDKSVAARTAVDQIIDLRTKHFCILVSQSTPKATCLVITRLLWTMQVSQHQCYPRDPTWLLTTKIRKQLQPDIYSFLERMEIQPCRHPEQALGILDHLAIAPTSALLVWGYC